MKKILFFLSIILFIIFSPFFLENRFLFHSKETLKEMICSIAFAILLAFPIGIAMANNNFIKKTIQPIFLAMQCIPMFVLAPLMIIFFGWSYISIIIPTTLMVLFPLTINIYKGFLATPKNYINFFQIHKFSRFQILYKIKIFFALPHIFAGLRTTSAIASIGAIGGEMAGAQSGLGVLLQESRRNFDFNAVSITLLSLFILTICFYSLFLSIENYFIKKFPNIQDKN